MMVAASALHERQQHDLDEMQKENSILKKRVDGLYADSESRVVGGKGKAEEQLDRSSVEAESGQGNIWEEFAMAVGRF